MNFRPESCLEDFDEFYTHGSLSNGDMDSEGHREGKAYIPTESV